MQPVLEKVLRSSRAVAGESDLHRLAKLVLYDVMHTCAEGGRSPIHISRCAKCGERLRAPAEVEAWSAILCEPTTRVAMEYRLEGGPVADICMLRGGKAWQAIEIRGATRSTCARPR